ncbi:SDR family oxidoreductase [Streptomyces sp. SAS_276]|uniref:SDR family oxidoreductase n=1 Tax=Streptomyces sp. SAS_276 TaxID=3412745 RepID=UPI00403CB8D7
MQGKVAVISGGSTGVGRAVEAQLAENGADVVLLVRGAERLEAAAREMTGSVWTIPTDVSSGDSAGAARIRVIEETADEDIHTCIGTNPLGPIHTVRSAVPLLRPAGGGDILNISSEITLDPMPLLAMYSARGHGLNGFTAAMHKEPRGDGIPVALVLLGSISDSAFFENFSGEDPQRAAPVRETDGYLTRGGAMKPLPSATVARAMFQLLSTPPEVVQDVVHIRPAG